MITTSSVSRSTTFSKIRAYSSVSSVLYVSIFNEEEKVGINNVGINIIINIKGTENLVKPLKDIKKPPENKMILRKEFKDRKYLWL